MAATAPRVEARGITHGWVSETVADPYAAAAVGLLGTSTLRLGTAVSIAFARSPFVVAQSAWELSRASGGRFVLGLGTQVRLHAERRLSVPWDPPIARLKEYVGALRSIWSTFQTGRALDFRGRFYTHTVFNEHFDPGPSDYPDIPIYLSGINRGMAALAGEVANGLVLHPLHTVAYLEQVILPAVTGAAVEHDRSPTQVELLVPVWVVTGEDEGERRAAREAVRRQIGLFGSTRAYRQVLAASGWPELPEQLNLAMKAGGPRLAATHVPDAALDAIAVDAAPGALQDALDARLGGIASAALLYDPLPPSLRAQLFG